MYVCMYVCQYIYIYIGLVRPQASRRGFFSSKKQYSIFTKLYIHLRGVLECVFKCPGKKISNMASPANLTMLSRTASKFCAHICAAPPEIFFLDLKSYEHSGIIGPWPECHLTPTATATAATARQQPSLLSPPPPSSPVQEKISRSGKPLTLIKNTIIPV